MKAHHFNDISLYTFNLMHKIFADQFDFGIEETSVAV